MSTVAKTQDGQDTSLMTDNVGRLLVSPTLGSSVPAPFQTVTYINTAGDILIHNGVCVLWGFTSNNSINKATMTIYDGVDATGKVIGNFDISGVFDMPFPGNGIYMNTGLFIHVATAADITVISADLTTIL